MIKDTLIRGEKIRRFGPARIIEHWMHVIAFSILVITGLSQKFYSLDISQWIIFSMGGIDNARLTHRYAGTLFLVLLASHMCIAIVGISFRRWQPSMFITRKDFSDAAHNIKYYVGLKDHPARCGRYDYKQKFEYWGILLGAIIMVASGLALWFPTLVTHYLPGETIPVAKALHTNEALLILLLIALWHIYNAIFSPEVFPLDRSMFTGYISRKRMVREHPLELVLEETKNSENISEYAG